MVSGLPMTRSADEIRRAVHYEFGLPKEFRFTSIIFTGGGEDVFQMTSFPRRRADGSDRGLSGEHRFRFGAVVEGLGGRPNREVTGADFVRERKDYLAKLCKEFRCNIVDCGAGFPDRERAVRTRADFSEASASPHPRSSTRAHHLLAWCRQELTRSQEGWAFEDAFSPNSIRVFPFGLPYHHGNMFWQPAEYHLQRVAMHYYNSMTLLARWSWGVASDLWMPFYMCGGVPR
jgi:hypothetical protein